MKSFNNMSVKKETSFHGKRYCKYKNSLEIFSNIMRHKPLSLLKFKELNNEQNKTLGFVTIREEIYFPDDIKFVTTENYANLFKFEGCSSLNELNYHNYEEDEVEDYVIAMPYHIDSSFGDNLYTFISKEGKELQKDFSLTYSQL